ncbi:peptidoglycan-binding protein [Eubacteriales bacterium OttesenSCG-928-K08]|nr:peptidoglycan-binding protein [Eubacteriales bacterium OttesenSCG-928-K08]
MNGLFFHELSCLAAENHMNAWYTYISQKEKRKLKAGMKRYRFACLVAALLLVMSFVPTSQAAIHNDEGQLGLVDYKDTGEIVVLIQTRLRDLDYFFFKATGRFQSMTRESVISFQKNQEDSQGNALISDGTVGAQSLEVLFSTRAVRSPIAQHIQIPIGKRADGTQTLVGEQTPWETISTKLEEGKNYRLIDFNTGVEFEMTFVGGQQHAEMECASASDTAVYLETFGGVFNYSKRPMLIELNGTMIACSLQGQPHGDDVVSRNEMDGHACLFFFESKSHVGLLPDREHNNNIYAAAGKSS